jgi:hypothetical protein
VDAVLLLTGAADSLLRRARSCWHNWALGVQFYDDALDVEEDFRNRNLTWAVGRVLECYHRSADNPAIETESFFDASARLAEPAFPSWVPFQKACVSQARRLREDYEKLLTGA